MCRVVCISRVIFILTIMNTKIFIALDGVTCTFKTTIIQKFARRITNLVHVHLSDYAELTESLELINETTAPIIYTAARMTELAMCGGGVHIFDRTSISYVLHKHIFTIDNDVDRLNSLLYDFKSLDLCHLMADWKNTIVLLTKPGQE